MTASPVFARRGPKWQFGPASPVTLSAQFCGFKLRVTPTVNKEYTKMLKTAVLWWKACSVIKPDYYVEYLPDNPWIHQPFEVYDTLRPDALRARLGAEAPLRTG